MTEVEPVALTSIRFREFKALKDFSLALDDLTVLVGPNNSGKSTVIASLRVLSAALRTARAKNPTRLRLPGRDCIGYQIPEDSIPVSLENVHTDYLDREASVAFRFSNRNQLSLVFPFDGGCYLVPEVEGRSVSNTTEFRRAFPFEVVAVPVLGPVEHNEELFDAATVRRNLATHRAARNFRNYWRHFPEGFDDFAALLASTWPDVTIAPPDVAYTPSGTYLFMMCSEGRTPRELFWMGVGFQVWCQILTHLIRAGGVQLLVIDEPEIYLHPSVQRQLVGLLRQAGADVLLATHSSEIVTESEPNELVMIDKRQRSGRRLKSGPDVAVALRYLGSAQNLVYTQVARTRHLLFVEGDEYRIIGAFARLLSHPRVAAALDFAIWSYGGFPVPEAIVSMSEATTQALGEDVQFAGVFDRDYRCDEEVADVQSQLDACLRLVHIQRRKETENYLLVPEVLQRAVESAARDRSRRTGTPPHLGGALIVELLDRVTAPLRFEIQGQYVGKGIDYRRKQGLDSSTVASEVTQWFDRTWATLDSRLEIVPGKDVLRALNHELQQSYGIALTWRAIVAAFRQTEVPLEMRALVDSLSRFGASVAE
jgi:energy-coupling factor transporter ATP-binding protein EcfA2